MGYPDSNQERQDQNLQCYHYTIPQFLVLSEVVSFLRVQRYDFFWNCQNFWPLFYKIPQKNIIPCHNWNNICNFASNYYTIIYDMNPTAKLIKTIIKGIQEKKGSGIVVADLSGIDGTICSQFVVCQGNSPAQVEAIAESVGEMCRKDLREKPVRVVGLENAQWVAMDFTDVLVHVFLPDVRDYYDLEHLWDDAKLTRIPDLD